MITAGSGTTYVRAEARFGVAEATRLRDALALLAPVNHLSIDFGSSVHVEDAALSIVAEMLGKTDIRSFQLTGLPRHRRRLLRYMGVGREQGGAIAA